MSAESASSERTRGVRRVSPAAAMLAVAAAVIAVFVLRNEPAINGDSIAIISGADKLVDCFRDGISAGCSDTGEPGFDEVGPFPPLQYLLVLPLNQIGLGQADVLDLLRMISLLCFCGLLALFWHVGRRLAVATAPLLALIVLVSPLLYYARATFGEMLATFLLAAMVAVSLRRSRSSLLFVLALATCLTKETAFPFVVLLAGVALWAAPSALAGDRPLRRAQFAAVGGGVLLAIVVHAAFNWFRYEQLTNANYTREIFRVPGMQLKGELALGLWGSPNGGLVVFWPLAALVCAGILWIAVSGVVRSRKDLRSWLPAAAAVAALGGQTAVLASWWAPYGWQAWGPRLLIPVVPGAILLGVAAHAERIQAALALITSSRIRIGALAAVTVIAALPNAGALARPELTATLFQPDAECPVDPSIATMAGEYYHCLTHRAWHKDWIVADVAGAADNGVGSVLSLGIAGAIVLLAGTASPQFRWQTRRAP